MKTLTYLFGFYPGSEFRWFYVLLIFFVMSLVAGIAIDIYSKKSTRGIITKTFKKLPGHLQVLSIIGIILLLMRIGGVGFFSMRLFLFVLLTAMGLVILNAIRNYFIILPKAAVEDATKKEQDKYLPKTKHTHKKKRR